MVVERVALVATLTAFMVILFQKFETIRARHLSTAILDECQYNRMCVRRHALASIWHIEPNVRKLLAPSKQRVRIGRFFVHVLPVDRHVECNDLAALPSDFGRYVVFQIGQSRPGDIVGVVITKLFCVRIPLLPGAILRARTVVILLYCLCLRRIVQMQMTDAPADVLGLVEPRVIAVNRKA